MEEDCFDRLTDDLLLVIFNKLGDAKSLTRCISVSKRFASLVFEADTVFLSIPPRKHNPLRRNLFKILIGKLIAKPLHFFHHFIADRPDANRKVVSFYSPEEVLKHFRQVKTMHIELPSDGGKTGLMEGNDSLLKWKARFGSEIKSFAILSATSFQKRVQPLSSGDDFSENNGEVLTDGQLKLQIVLTISCLLAASARHYLMKQVLEEHHALENIIASDACKQGKVCMGKDEVAEIRNSIKSMVATDSSLERTRVPDLSMRLWYAPVLELPENGYIMRGATLVVLRPNGDGQIGNGKKSGLFGFDGEECERKAYSEAAREMMKMKKSYLMTMESF
uniref:F-box domain-containing protein n=1 Tax=Salix viminalis TaxID=40686 RepID=A0A6N2L2H1_SALVM